MSVFELLQGDITLHQSFASTSSQSYFCRAVPSALNAELSEYFAVSSVQNVIQARNSLP